MPSNAINLRNIGEPQWPQGGFTFTRNIDYQYDVNVWGYPVASNPTNLWSRGDIVKRYQPQLHMNPLGLFAYDPSDPTTWHQPQH